MKKYNINANLIRVIKNLYDKATSTVLFNSSIGDWFRTKVRVQQECLLSPTLFNIFLERIMTDALEDHEGTVSTGGRTITIFRFADDIDGLDGDQCREDQADDKQHQWRQDRDESKWTVDETVTRFKYLGSVITDEGSKPEILSRIAQKTAALTRLK